MATSHGANSELNPERADNNESQHLIQSQNTCGCFSFSTLASYARTMYNVITNREMQSTDAVSPSTSVFPGSYHAEIFSPVTVEALKNPIATSQQTTSLYKRDIGNNDTTHMPTSQQNKFEDGSTKDSQRSATMENFGDHIGLHKPDQGSLVPPFSAQSISAMFQGAHGFNISGSQHFVNIGSVMSNLGALQGLETMKELVSFAALYNSSAQDPDRRCHPGTRKTVLSRIQHWIGNTNTTEPILWMHGPAGAGKTAIAQTIAHSFGQDKVAATFFFYRSDTARNDGNRLFTTLAWQLAFSIPAVKCHIADSLGKQPDIPMKNVETQFEELIVKPFQCLNEAASLDQLLAPVVIIDGIDECTDERLQQRFLKVIGNAVSNRRLPLRFLISSRPEAHIQETVDRFECPIHLIDLAKVDDAHHDIEKYLKDEFSRIASEQDLDETWPGQETIRKFVDKSSGQFVYASTVIRYVGDPHNSAITQLEIVLGLKPARTKSPFAELDELYLEILRRQPDQVFLIEFFKVLVARSVISVNGLHKDDAMLMEVSDKELRRKLRGMRSLLQFEPSIDVYHRSFLDFLQDSSRSGQYHISEQSATRRYLELIARSLIRYVSKVMEEPDYHKTYHFLPYFYQVVREYPPKIELPVDDWQEALRPLVDFQDKLLTIPDFAKILPCDKSMVFNIIRDFLLHLAFLRGTSRSTSFSIRAAKSLSNEPVREANMATLTDAEQNMPDQNLDRCLSLLLTQLREMELELSVDVALINLTHKLLLFDCAETIMRIRSASDAQNLIDLIDFINSNEHSPHYGRDTARKAARLALGIFARVPVLPRSLFLSDNDRPCHEWTLLIGVEFEILCQSALMARILDHDYIVPLLRMQKEQWRLFVSSNVNEKNKTVQQWRESTNPSVGRRLHVMLELAKTIQYFHSMGVILHYVIGLDDIFLDSEFRVKVHFGGTTAQYIQETPLAHHIFSHDKTLFSNGTNVFMFGCFFYEMYFDRAISYRKRIGFNSNIVAERPSKPEIHEDAWQLIQRCCVKDARSRPTMDEIVREMEAW